MKRLKKEEEILVPVRRQQEGVPKQEPLKDPPEDTVLKPLEMPRRWYSY